MVPEFNEERGENCIRIYIQTPAGAFHPYIPKRNLGWQSLFQLLRINFFAFHLNNHDYLQKSKILIQM